MHQINPERISGNLTPNSFIKLIITLISTLYSYNEVFKTGQQQLRIYLLQEKLVFKQPGCSKPHQHLPRPKAAVSTHKTLYRLT